ncbi:MAG TPA: zinc ribbon domain-containing protein, partial [Candidatus Krumholzibacteria bacterium]|nr:zinc ribbon domain-containing protein [Candidatus Krumholzibacteria bacterium]
MPTYEYECTKCGLEFELEQAMTDKPRQRCPECRGKVNRLIS